MLLPALVAPEESVADTGVHSANLTPPSFSGGETPEVLERKGAQSLRMLGPMSPSWKLEGLTWLLRLHVHAC